MPRQPDEPLRVGDPPIEIVLRRHARARRYTLRISRSGGGATLTLPLAGSRREALAFAESREAWLRRHLDAVPGKVAVVAGAVLPFRGVDHRVVLRGRLRRVVAEGGEIVLPASGRASTGARVRAFLRTAAQARLAEAVARHCETLGVTATAIALRDPKGRWGSCTAQGRLMFSWRLVMAPDAVLDYVAAHEVAHLREMNHSPAFWAQVGRAMPGHAAPRDWLWRNGANLHRFDFAAD